MVDSPDFHNPPPDVSSREKLLARLAQPKIFGMYEIYFPEFAVSDGKPVFLSHYYVVYLDGQFETGTITTDQFDWQTLKPVDHPISLISYLTAPLESQGGRDQYISVEVSPATIDRVGLSLNAPIPNQSRAPLRTIDFEQKLEFHPLAIACLGFPIHRDEIINSLGLDNFPIYFFRRDHKVADLVKVLKLALDYDYIQHIKGLSN